MSNVSRHPTHPTTEPDSIDRPEPRRATRNIPPLAWIVIGILVAWAVVAMIQRTGSDRTPQGGTMPQSEERAAVMPAAPANGAAPATPGGQVSPAAR